MHDAEQAAQEDAMRWLLDENMLEREEEAEDPLGTGAGFHSEYGSVFRITDTGRELLEEVWEHRPE